MQWETVIGLEIHAQLATQSKIFSAASTAFGAEPNTQACPVDLGMPGILPVVNQEVVRMAVMFALATNAEIGQRSVFERKNYFYPDLPKGYQTSQFEFPIVGKGKVEIVLEDGSTKVVGLTRAHLEEDAGKSVHDLYSEFSAIDLNRAGTPLLEIVSEPDMRSAKEAVAYAKKIHSLVRYLGICDGNMQEGSFRCDANVSVRLKGESEFGTRAEVKNVNSFRFLERAINFEVERQIDLLESGGTVVQETRLYDPTKDETRSMRSKEDAEDYRYFPCPDLLPVVIEEADIQSIRDALPELPDQRLNRYQSQWQLSGDDARLLVQDRSVAEYFEAVANQADPKLASNWMVNEVIVRLDKDSIEIERSPVGPSQLAALIARIADKTINGKIGRQILDALWSGEASDVDSYIADKGLKQVTDTGAIEAWVDEVIANSPDQVQQIKEGKDKVMGFLVGQAMKLSKGKANPAQLSELFKAKILG
ncbi:MAG: Asp-tRNA(Asn)/Glu-tRNA(Gln) amidotransferase subunit GatB [Gammaproteobacteria bacterium]|nr:Asp-tRNA(Asn)/Glu-tRNA(Gln) amidotransferase subunit GatB [Gammaproteobacteria bacterium]